MKPNVEPIISHRETRRQFIKHTAATAAMIAGAPLVSSRVFGQSPVASVAIVLDADDAVAKQVPSQWAAEQLRDALKAHGITAQIFDKLAKAPADSECVFAGGMGSAAIAALAQASVKVEAVPEALGMARGVIFGRAALVVVGFDAAGLVYALLELADAVKFAKDPLAPLRSATPVAERPANAIRSIARCFVSDVEDRSWYNDRAFWREYLTMLATERFNRFSLTLGIGYDFTSNISDCYFHFAYPFLLKVPGYDVRAVPLPDAERDANLEMLKFIGEETARHGLHFHLGLWTHAYKWANSPHANYLIEGLTPETQGPYSRDALRALLVACPQIQGVTLRIHGESGVPEGSYDFWKMVFDGIVTCGRRVELDMHAKGMDQPTLDIALATGLPVSVSPKYWAEHLGLPYMQAGIRAIEMPKVGQKDSGFFAQSSGARSFLRYGYGDLLKEDRKYRVLHRIWPGTQRALLWGDPTLTQEYAGDFSFCGSAGSEFLEPLSFKGRRGSGLPGGRDAYALESLRTPGGGWEKFLYTYRLLGRLTYNPNTPAETWQRMLQSSFSASSKSIEASLGAASWILPLVTTAHCPSAANNNYWPEMYTNMSIPDEHKPNPYGDTLSPKRFGGVSPLDPQLFSRMDDFAQELLSGERTGKYSPAEVAQWLEERALVARRHLADAKAAAVSSTSPEFQRVLVDVTIQCGLGEFFAHKFRAGVCFALFETSGHKPALEQSLKSYRAAREAWAELARQAATVYAVDITYGHEKQLHGSWADRIAAIDEDIADLEKRLAALPNESGAAQKYDAKAVDAAIQETLNPMPRFQTDILHAAPEPFQRGEKIEIDTKFLIVKQQQNLAHKSARLLYRHVNQAEQWRSVELTMNGLHGHATIPAEYTDSPYPIQYYFEFHRSESEVWLHPGINLAQFNQPYYVLRQAQA